MEHLYEKALESVEYIKTHQIRISKDAIVGCDVAAHVTSA